MRKFGRCLSLVALSLFFFVSTSSAQRWAGVVSPSPSPSPIPSQYAGTCDDGTVYNTQTDQCCCEQVPDYTRRRRCGSGLNARLCYPEKTHCLARPKDLTCCGQDAYDPESQGCCMRTIFVNRIPWVPDGGGGHRRFGTSYDCATQECCCGRMNNSASSTCALQDIRDECPAQYSPIADGATVEACGPQATPTPEPVPNRSPSPKVTGSLPPGRF